MGGSELLFVAGSAGPRARSGAGGPAADRLGLWTVAGPRGAWPGPAALRTLPAAGPGAELAAAPMILQANATGPEFRAELGTLPRGAPWSSSSWISSGPAAMDGRAKIRSEKGILVENGPELKNRALFGGRRPIKLNTGHPGGLDRADMGLICGIRAIFDLTC